MIRIRARKPWGVERAPTPGELRAATALLSQILPTVPTALVPGDYVFGPPRGRTLLDTRAPDADIARRAADAAHAARMRHEAGRTLRVGSVERVTLDGDAMEVSMSIDDATADRLALLLMFAPDVCDDEGVWS